MRRAARILGRTGVTLAIALAVALAIAPAIARGATATGHGASAPQAAARHATPARAPRVPDAPPAGDACFAWLDTLAGVTYVPADDSTRVPRGRATACWFKQSNRYTFTYSWACHGDSMDVMFSPRAVIEVHREQFVRRPADSLRTPEARRRWQQYVHDRLALTHDERPVLLLEWLVAHLPELHGRTKCGAKVQGAFADRVFADAIGPRYVAVVNLVRACDDTLAARTRQGTATLPDREAYFAALYERDALVRAGFPYLADVESLLVQPRYVHAPRPRCDAVAAR